MKRISFFIFGVVVALISLGATTTAQAAKVNAEGLSPAEISQLKTFFHDNNVAEATISSLEKKMREGGIPDSLNPEEYPIAFRINENDGRQITIDEFADGSIVRTEIPSFYANGFIGDVQNSLASERSEKGNRGNAAKPLGVSGCTTTSSSRYRITMAGCKASTSWGIRSLSFLFDVTQNNGGPGTIDRYYGGQCSGVGVLSNLALDRVSSSKVRLTCHFNTDMPVSGTSVYWLQASQGTGINLATTRGMS